MRYLPDLNEGNNQYLLNSPLQAIKDSSKILISMRVALNSATTFPVSTTNIASLLQNFAV